jgi:hypothetical protein
VFAGDRIILSWGCLIALDAVTGKTLWKASETKSTYGTLVVTKVGGESVVVSPAGDILRLSNGEVLCTGLFNTAHTTPLIEGDKLFVVDNQARAFQLPSKAEKGMRLKELWKTKLDGQFMASPVYRDGLLYTVENKKCRLYILDAKSGQLLTSIRVVDKESGSEKVDSGSKLAGLAPGQYAYASPTATEKHVFFFDDAGNSVILGLGRDGKPCRVNKLEDSLSGTPFFFKDRIIFRSAKAVCCIGEKHVER